MDFLSYSKPLVIIMASYVTLFNLLLTGAIAKHCIGLIWASSNVVSKGKKSARKMPCIVYLLG